MLFQRLNTNLPYINRIKILVEMNVTYFNLYQQEYLFYLHPKF